MNWYFYFYELDIEMYREEGGRVVRRLGLDQVDARRQLLFVRCFITSLRAGSVLQTFTAATSCEHRSTAWSVPPCTPDRHQVSLSPRYQDCLWSLTELKWILSELRSIVVICLNADHQYLVEKYMQFFFSNLIITKVNFIGVSQQKNWKFFVK